MKKFITLFAVWMMAVMAFAQNYGILITNTSELVSATYNGYFLENETTPYEQYLAHVNLSVGDRCKLYDLDNQTAWIVPLDEYSTSDIYLDQTNNEYVCAVGGCFDFYIKLRYNEDKLYIGAGSGCTNGTTPQGNDPVGEDISQEEEDDLTLCINDQQLYALSSGALSFSLYDSLGNLVNMVYAGSDDDGAVRYDMSGLATGRYTLVVNDDSYIFDHNLPLNITTSQQEGSNCTSYYVYSEAYVDSGQVYLYNCSRMTEPGLVQWDGLSIDNCDSTVVFNLMYNLDDPDIPQEEPTLGICVNDENLYIWGQEEINPIVYDADGNFVSLLVLEEPEDGGVLYDMSTLASGRYTLTINNETLLFDLGLQGPTSTSWDAETGCTIDNTVITVYIPLGERYIYGCEIYSDAVDLSNTYTAVNGCDSIVLIELRLEEEVPQEEERRICLSHKKLIITELNNSTPMLLDSAGQQVTMPVEGYPMENAIQYDLTSFGRGRYTLIVDSDTLLFDLGTEVTTSYTKEGEDCLTYNSVINATIKPGQTYLFICNKKTEPGTYGSILSNMTQCDSMVVLYLSFEEDEIPCEPDTLIIDAMTCEGGFFPWRGEELTEAGTYEFTVPQEGGCDSVYIINLTINPSYFIEEIVSVREDKLPFTWHEREITQSGEYFAELSTVLGCDSIIALRLTVTQLPIYSVTAVADHGFVNGTGTYPEGTEIYLEAQADEGFAFQMWSDGTTENPKNFILTRDTTLRALFYMPEVEQEVVVDSIETNSVTITWDTVAGAVLYELRIYKNGMLVVTYQVDRDNNIINQIFSGPDCLIARRDSTGGSSETLQVSVGGLEPGQDYTYSLDAMDDDRSYVGAQSGTFTTEEEPVEGLDALFDDRRNAPRKVISNGRLYIEMPDGTRYDATGQELIRN